MTSRTSIPVAILLVAMLFSAPAFGAIQGTAHEVAIGSQGACSACHIPHKAAGKRLWPSDMSGDEAAGGVVGSLCYYCHGPGGGTAMPTASQDLVWAALSHGRDSGQIPDGTVDATLPHGADDPFECTTCHNVHDDTNKPFLQDDIDLLCIRCHANRDFGTGQGNWAGGYGTSNSGSHPIGADVYTDSDANSPIDLATFPELTYDYGASESHNLGGHVIGGVDVAGSGNGITCATCHAVHGVQHESDWPAGGTAAVGSLLVIEQPSVTGQFDGAYNGHGDPNNALCEACHYEGSATTWDPGSGVGGAAYAGSLRPNPGATDYTHPVDDLGSSSEASVTAFPASWPVGGGVVAANVDPKPICESCHTPHPNANSDRSTILVGSGTHILRGSESDADAEFLCLQCHDFALGAGHHPYNVSMGRMSDADIGDGDGTLECLDCHAGGHNWSAPGPGLDPDWEPAGNGKNKDDSVERVTVDASKECADCHLGAGYESPTNNSGDSGAVVRGTDYEDIGEGSHYLGATGMDYSLGRLDTSTSFDATSDTWPGGGWSRFAGGGGTVGCESCHELEPDKNVAGTALLLANYVEGAAIDPSNMCEGCHGTAPGGGTPHPMTGDAVSRAGRNLGTAAPNPADPDSGGFSRGFGNEEGFATFPAADSVNCDSCHQPHDADTNGGTYIYDADEATHDVSSSNTSGDTRGGTIADIEDAPFCDSCHTYLAP